MCYCRLFKILSVTPVFRAFLGCAFTYPDESWQVVSIRTVILSHIWMTVGSKLLYEELQIKFVFCQGWPTFFMCYCPLFKIMSLTLVFQTCLSYAFTIWMTVGCKLLYKELQIKFDFRHGPPTFSWVSCRIDSVGVVGDLYCFSNTYSMLVVCYHGYSSY